MGIRNVLKYHLLLVLFFPFVMYGQGKDAYMGEIKKVVNLIKAEHDITYKYLMSVQYPNGEGDRVKGTIYIGEGNKLMYNSCDAFTLIFSDKWYYNADHRNKAVTVVDLGKHLKNDTKQLMQQSVFQKNISGVFLDSVLMRYARVKHLKKEGDTVNIELSFPPQMPLKSISVVYNEKEKKLIAYTVQTFQPWQNNEFGRNKGTTQEVTCSGFNTVADDREYRTDNYFSVSKGAVTLKKYNKYKLNTKL